MGLGKPCLFFVFFLLSIFSRLSCWWVLQWKQDLSAANKHPFLSVLGFEGWDGQGRTEGSRNGGRRGLEPGKCSELPADPSIWVQRSELLSFAWPGRERAQKGQDQFSLFCLWMKSPEISLQLLGITRNSESVQEVSWCALKAPGCTDRYIHEEFGVTRCGGLFPSTAQEKSITTWPWRMLLRMFPFGIQGISSCGATEHSKWFPKF